MTKFQKQMLTIAAAGALTAVTALPAMAFENEFHGMMIWKTYFSNFDKADGAGINPAAATWGEKRKMNNYMDQRTRIQYIAKASDDLKMVTHFEINSKFGDAATGGDLETDGNNIVTKHAYLDFNVGKSFNTKVGLQAYKDQLKGIFIDADVPAVMTTTKLGAYTLGLGFARYNDKNISGTTTARLGDADTDLFIMDNTYALNKDTKLGFSYYFLADYARTNIANDLLLHTFGLTGSTKLAGINLSGFAAMQAGHMKNGVAIGRNLNYHGWAANVAADMKLGIGKAKTAFLFTSGDNGAAAGNGLADGSYKGWQYATNGVTADGNVNSYVEGGMMIIARNSPSGGTGTDNYIRKQITNLALLTAGYDANLTEKTYLNTNVGFAWAPNSNTAMVGGNGAVATVNPLKNGSDFMGAEVNMELGHKLYNNLTLYAQAAYVFLGGYYKDTAAGDNPANPYTMRLGAKFNF